MKRCAPETKSERQALYAGFVKPREIAHDTAIYRLFQAEGARIAQEGGRITRVDSAVLEELVDAGRVPVVAPAAIEAPGDGEPLDEVFNVNADSVAGAIAASLSARLLVFVTDVPGVRAKDGKVIGSLDLGRAKALIDDGTIEGGMLPKVEACLVAARAGCRAAIVAAQGADAVERLLAGDSIGTVFEAAA